MTQQPLTTFMKPVQEGIGYIKDGHYEQGLEKMKPFIKMMEEAKTLPIQIFYYYAVAQFKSGDVEGFMSTYELMKMQEAANGAEEKMKADLDAWFEALLNGLNEQ
ncbi:hypothetical protein MM326_13015 [Alkalihalobacillus sp. LMS6]|uniref:hypothetical protein n=1 Tax=Bacillaceae TaxID=186817 RepID=UPI000C078A15|nr:MULTISPECIES: hypothetical protein [Bacillaceae]UTR05030.1 hypothetical protein MM326_13015 [Alkalihalobacillus sp. LMS6]